MNQLFGKLVLELAGYQHPRTVAERLQREAAQAWKLAQVLLHGDGSTLAEILLVEGAKKRGLPLTETQLRLRAGITTQIRAAALYRQARELLGNV